MSNRWPAAAKWNVMSPRRPALSSTPSPVILISWPWAVPAPSKATFAPFAWPVAVAACATSDGDRLSEAPQPWDTRAAAPTARVAMDTAAWRNMTLRLPGIPGR